MPLQVRFLIELGHSVNVRTRHGQTPLMSCALVEEESWGVGLARLLLEKGASLQPKDKHELNAMQYACIYERPGLVKTFIRAADFNLNHRDRFGNTALHYSVTNGNIKITEMIINSLLKYKQSVDIQERGWCNSIIASVEMWTHGLRPPADRIRERRQRYLRPTRK